MNKAVSLATLTFLALHSWGCDSADPTENEIDDPDPDDDVSLIGELQSSETVRADVAVLWSARSADGAPGAAGVVLEVVGAPPASFQLDIDGPPPEEAMLDTAVDWESPTQYSTTEVRYAQGYIAALEPGAIDAPDFFSRLADFQDPAIYGWAKGYTLIYLEDDVAAGSVLDRYMCGPHRAGYYLTIGELAPSGPFADCESNPGGSEGGGALMAVAPDNLRTKLSIGVCEDEFISCSEE